MRITLLLVAFFTLLSMLPVVGCTEWKLSNNGKRPVPADMAHGPDLDVSDLDVSDLSSADDL